MLKLHEYLKTLNEREAQYISLLFDKYQVKNFNDERLKFINNGKKNYPNGFILNKDNEVDIFIVMY